MKLTLLGTGNATVTACYNTCFLLEKDEVIDPNNKYLLVDGGGGNQILSRLKQAGVDWKNVRDIFVTHKHIDHVMGIIWLIRMICQNMRQGSYKGEARIYAHDELIEIIQNIANTLIQKKDMAYLGKQLKLIPVHDGETHTIIGCPVTFFDIQSTKAKQFGFSMMDPQSQKKITCCGDEPYNPCEEAYAKDSDWLLHEAFCLYSEAERFKPYEKHHSTVKDACELAEQLSVKNLVLYHTEDKNYDNRKALYMAEGKNYYHGNLYVPDDMESLLV